MTSVRLAASSSACWLLGVALLIISYPILTHAEEKVEKMCRDLSSNGAYAFDKVVHHIVVGTKLNISCASGYTQQQNITTIECLLTQQWSTLPNCTDENECESGSHNCSSRMSCQNMAGTFRCRCLPGYAANTSITGGLRVEPGDDTNETCINVDECNMNLTDSHKLIMGGSVLVSGDSADGGNDGDLASGGVCRGNFLCTDTVGSYSCVCPHGYRVLRASCLDIDECTNQCTSQSTVCTNQDGSFMCECREGFSGNASTQEGCQADETSTNNTALEIWIPVALIIIGTLSLSVGFATRRWKAHLISKPTPKPSVCIDRTDVENGKSASEAEERYSLTPGPEDSTKVEAETASSVLSAPSSAAISENSSKPPVFTSNTVSSESTTPATPQVEPETYESLSDSLASERYMAVLKRKSKTPSLIPHCGDVKEEYEVLSRSNSMSSKRRSVMSSSDDGDIADCSLQSQNSDYDHAKPVTVVMATEDNDDVYEDLSTGRALSQIANQSKRPTSSPTHSKRRVKSSSTMSLKIMHSDVPKNFKKFKSSLIKSVSSGFSPIISRSPANLAAGLGDDFNAAGPVRPNLPPLPPGAGDGMSHISPSSSAVRIPASTSRTSTGSHCVTITPVMSKDDLDRIDDEIYSDCYSNCKMPVSQSGSAAPSENADDCGIYGSVSPVASNSDFGGCHSPLQVSETSLRPACLSSITATTAIRDGEDDEVYSELGALDRNRSTTNIIMPMNVDDDSGTRFGTTLSNKKVPFIVTSPTVRRGADNRPTAKKLKDTANKTAPPLPDDPLGLQRRTSTTSTGSNMYGNCDDNTSLSHLKVVSSNDSLVPVSATLLKAVKPTPTPTEPDESIYEVDQEQLNAVVENRSKSSSSFSPATCQTTTSPQPSPYSSPRPKATRKPPPLSPRTDGAGTPPPIVDSPRPTGAQGAAQRVEQSEPAGDEDIYEDPISAIS